MLELLLWVVPLLPKLPFTELVFFRLSGLVGGLIVVDVFVPSDFLPPTELGGSLLDDEFECTNRLDDFSEESRLFPGVGDELRAGGGFVPAAGFTTANKQNLDLLTAR